MFKLKACVLFRLERDEVLICDCSKLQDYSLPLSSYDFLLKLQKGIGRESLKKHENEIITDLMKANMIKNEDDGYVQYDVFPFLENFDNDFWGGGTVIEE